MEKEGWAFPRYDYYTNGGIFTGSRLLTAERNYELEFRYRLAPSGDTLKVSVWKGPYCFEKSEMAGEKEFSLTEEEIQLAHTWITEQYENIKMKLEEGKSE